MTEPFKDETVIAQIGALEGISEKEPAMHFLSGPSMGQQIILKDGSYVVGRSKNADIPIADETISRCHFKITVENKIATIEDLESTNGTFVNGQRIDKKILNANDKIQISSNTVLRFSYLDLVDKNTHERIYEMALYDAVTNAHTKRYFLDRLEHEFAHASRNNRPLSLILFDLDFFKKVNDQYGHLAGDFVLQMLSATTKTIIRAEDVFARYGGEEFVILMRDANENESRGLAERLRERIEQSEFIFEKHLIPVTISVGVACFYNSNFKSTSDFIQHTDRCLYLSKAQGRNCVSSMQDLTL